MLLPVAWVVDMLRLDIKFSGQRLYERFDPFYLEVCRTVVFVVGYDADSDGLTAAIPGLSRYDGPLSLPIFGRLYLTIIGTEAIADNKVIADVLRAGQAAERGQLFDVSSLGVAVVDFDAVPAVIGLGGLGGNSFFNGVETIITGEAKWTCRGRIVTEGH